MNRLPTGLWAGMLWLCLFLPAPAQSLRPPVQTLAQLKDTLRQVMHQQHIPGMMLVLTTRDSVLYAGGLGYADVGRKRPVDDNHLFRMGSITKLFTALGILNLVQAGKLKLDDPVRSLAPELPIDNPWESTHPVRVIHLLEHTAGFSDKTPNKAQNFGSTDLRGLEAVQFFAPSLHSRWKSGERHSYVNTGYNVAAYLIEKLSGKPWEQYMTEAVFRPMGMPNATVQLRPDASRRYAQGYFWQNDHYQPVPFLPLYQGGNGSLNASASDMAACLRLYLNGWKTPAGRSYLSRKVLDETEIPHTTLAARAGVKVGYGLGNEATGGPDGFVFHGHKGSIGAFVSSMGYNRELGVGYAYAFTTHQDIGPVETIIRHFLTQSATPDKPVLYPLEANAVEPFLGYYRFDSPQNRITGIIEQLRVRFRLQKAGNTLTETLLLGPSIQLQPTGPTTFRMAWSNQPTGAFVTDSDGHRAIMESGLYFRQISALEAWAPLVLLLISVLIMASSLITGAVWLAGLLLGKIRRPTAWLRLLPALGFAMLAVAVIIGLSGLDQHIIQGTSMLFDSWLVFIGTLLFPICLLAALVLLVLQWRQLTNRALKSYLIVILLAGGYLTGFMIANGWLAIRIWAL
ncbi:serine hydrolase domain-containing protein [Spirosoma utsteinense]|uniref:serine hydrolase domain-containing protein n=1 Tax=Spirosoma utsteinense TaxID=2585773 RepID=UPI0016452E6D|nr:serine hydrolase domain-containing protein [Spirosoma utsteinense]MBC3784122.1 CubicO group peptidase (beta-lactamase class C family) [Spirosoma utsteinense]